LYVDTFCDLNKSLPFPDNFFDTIILSDVLEHIAEPGLLFGEMRRILQQKGKILMNVPFYHPVHEAPYDFFRYTEFALYKFADKSNLQVLELSSSNGFTLVAIDTICMGVHKIPIIGTLLTTLLQKMAKHLNKSNDHFPLQYFVVLQKN
jgi:ubiquinone/menaquinone biosynthesis C-methylase UbiE